VARSARKAFLRHPRREKGVLTGAAAALLIGGGAAGFTVAQVAGSSAEQQPGQQQDVRPAPGSGEFQPPPGLDGRVYDDGGFDPGDDDGGSTISEDET